MNSLKRRKDPKKAVLLALCPGLGFLYLENIKYWLVFAFLCVMPLSMISKTGNSAILISALLYGLSIYYTHTLAVETLRYNDTYKKDPYYILCLSVLFDGLGQIALKQYKKAYIMMGTGLTSCILGWVYLISKYGFMDLILATNESNLYMITNIMIIWSIISIPVKALSLIDAYYSTYHLYVAKK